MPDAEPPYARMADYVLSLVREDPRLDAYRESGEAVLLSCHTRAIWLHSMPRGAAGFRYEGRLEAPEWWMPLKRSRGQAIADELVTRLLAAWEARTVNGC